MKQAEITSAFVRGTEAVPVTVEVAIVAEGAPSFAVLGMTEESAAEARERVRCAILSAGFSFPRERIVVNVAPASLRKAGSSFDLAIAAGILAATGQIDPTAVEDAILVGELSLEGHVRPVRGGMAFAKLAAEKHKVLVCWADVELTELVDENLKLAIVPVKALGDLREKRCAPFEFAARETTGDAEPEGDMYSDLVLYNLEAGGNVLLYSHDMETARRSVMNAVRRLPAISDEDLLEAQVIASAAGVDMPWSRPFRMPHHSATLAGLIGGGMPICPGEVTLAHKGVLFLEDIAGFKPSALEHVALAWREKKVDIVRADGNVSMPADFLVVMAAKPCPCGHFGDPDSRRECHCPEHAIRRYQEKIDSWAHRFNARIIY